MTTLTLTNTPRLPLWAHGLATISAFGLFQTAKSALDASYAASGHPVDYVTGQTAFDAQQIEAWYAAMLTQDTLHIYWQTQIIDFGFIAAIMLLGLTLRTLVARLGRFGSWGRRLGYWAAGFAIAGATMDILENLLSFIMLNHPDSIPQALAILYSSMAVAKFGLLTLAMATLLASLITGAWSRLRGA